ncbi:MAG: AAA family ATPase [Synechococcus sp. SB0662_bin_45]|nr:AAA family ATPase [Synechococcus sp. SB0668_bin_13]MYE21627.1 AAA family ATPase [Synechococcus sp. SB0662_bin_45]
MHSVTIENFRCFGKKQTARLAPLTLLVGENSTGKTSFLALLRALDDFFHNDVPDFKKPPYDLGSFDEIAHYRGGRGGRAETFSAEITFPSTRAGRQGERRLSVRFGKDRGGTAPIPVYLRISLASKSKKEDTWVALNYGSSSIEVSTKRGRWNLSEHGNLHHRLMPSWQLQRQSMHLLAWSALGGFGGEKDSRFTDMYKPEEGSPDVTAQDMQDLRPLTAEIIETSAGSGEPTSLFASAPVRSQPHRTYNPARLAFDPEGDYVPMFLAELSSKQPKVWDKLKHSLENFGQSSGLFDEIRIRRFGTSHSNPFQVQVKKSGQTRQKGPWRNLIDVGYGVSQALPIITELLRDEAEQRRPESPHPRQFLLQQPEVHLHPSAQAALGSLFCQVASPRRQLIVETHSDNLMDRVCMDVRDGVSDLKPEDVSILFFERRGLDVRIHSLGLDKEGNVLGAPDGYRQFFMDEMTRSLWPERSSERSKVEA